MGQADGSLGFSFLLGSRVEYTGARVGWDGGFGLDLKTNG